MAFLNDNMRGALLMTGSMTAFTVNDAFMKALSDELPLFQSIFLRSIGVLICLTFIGLAVRQLNFRQSARDWKFIGLRSIFEVGGALFFLSALFNMPIANVSAILQALPLTVSLAAAVFLGAEMGWRRLSAILIGLVGVLLIVKPGGEGFNTYSLSALAAVGCVTVRDLLVRKISSNVPSMLVAWFTAFAVMTGAGLASITETWRPLSGLGQIQLTGAILTIIGGYIFSVTAMRHGDIAFVAPFRYTSLLVAVVLGFIVFAEVPDTLTIIGAMIVVATGLFTLYRETALKRRRQIRA